MLDEALDRRVDNGRKQQNWQTNPEHCSLKQQIWTRSEAIEVHELMIAPQGVT